MGVMVCFCCPYSHDEEPLTMGPYEDVEINDGQVSVTGGEVIAYFSEDEQGWYRDGRLYDSVKIFAASSVVPA